MGFMDIFKISEIKQQNEKMKALLNKAVEIKRENEKLKTTLNEIGGLDLIQIKERIEKLKAEESTIVSEQQVKLDGIKKAETEFLETSKANNERLRAESKALDLEIADKKKQIISLDEEILLESFALYKPRYAFENSSEYQKQLEIIRAKQKTMIKDQTAALAPNEWTVNGSKSEGKKLVNDTKKLVLRSFNNECDYCVDHVKFNNIETSEKRINSSFDALNRLGNVMKVSLSSEYKGLKFKELYLAYEYQKKKQEEKEEQRRLREDMREQQKLEREIQETRDRIAKERQHYSNAIENIEYRIANVAPGEPVEDLIAKLAELKKQNTSLDEEEKLVDYREQNAKAGYVYVISNIGAFGENIYKIGMTRRLEPLERVSELGDASVPYPFDVHALIFSPNAPDLEAKIQSHFHAYRLNKINDRKEFYRADINEIEKAIKENFDKVVDLVKIPPAEQYRESLKIAD